MNKIPTRKMAGNLRWTRSGTVWADWLLRPIPYGLRPAKEKNFARDMHAALFRALPGESLLLGLVSGQDPAAVVERMIDGVDLEEAPEWKVEAEATLYSLDEIGPSERLYWLSVPLGVDKSSDRGLEPLKAKQADLFDWIGLPLPATSSADVERRLRQASLIAELIPDPFQPKPVTPAQMIWLHGHQLQRGLHLDMDLPASTDTGHERPGSALGSFLLDEGGMTDLAEGESKAQQRVTHRQGFHKRRYLKVTPADVDDAPASYQALSVISDSPSEGFVFPGGELLGRLDQSTLPVEWALRLTTRTSSEVAVSNTRALRNLNDQYQQQDGTTSASGFNKLDRAAEAMGEYASILENDSLEIECQATMILCLAGPDPDVLRQHQIHLRDYVSLAGYKLTQPLGYQMPLWWAMQPGVRSSRHVREFSHVTTSRGLAALIPLASVELGDRRGSVLGMNIANGPMLAPNLTAGVSGVVMHDLEGASDRHMSGSLGIGGEPGGGKSALIKKLVADVINRGGRAIIVDHTSKGEYALWAEHIAQTVVVDIDEPAYSLDPLRIFGPKIGQRVASSFLTPLLRVPPTSERGALLSEVLSPGYLAQHHLTSLGDVVEHLETQDGAGGELARVMRVFARQDIGRIIFDPSVPALDITSRAIVIRTHTVELPSKEDLLNQHLFEEMGLEKVMGRALYSLLMALARTVCFSDDSELGVYALDESHSVTISPESEREAERFVRDGRKHRAALIMGSQDPEADFGSKTLRGLIPTRILTRQRDRDLAVSGLKWLGLEPTDELVEILTKDTSPVSGNDERPPEHRGGEALMRDSSANLGRVKILLPAAPHLRKAALSTPEALAGRRELELT